MAPVAVIRLKFVPARFPSLRQLDCSAGVTYSTTLPLVFNKYDCSLSSSTLYTQKLLQSCGALCSEYPSPLDI
ncbi:hypothetical protein AMELA_G00195080 [Ameiurus melas]|uniref:Uncharacterized protein n=1 Tax=Ameiurus melas TaxID=219545 RepID=A0A7J6A7B6_AMEME|nr:hypothetical protein AMELA_G00195080 [Ameiurus melas]